MLGDFHREYLIRLPLPLAQLYHRTHNAPSARARHDNAFYLFEALIKLADCVLVAAYKHECEQGSRRVDTLEYAISNLTLPSVGQWVSLLRELARHFGGRSDAPSHPLGHIWEQMDSRRRDLPSIVSLYRRVKNGPDGPPSADGGCSLLQLLYALVSYRNELFGHSGARPDSYYEKGLAPLMCAAASEILAEGVFDGIGPRGSRLVCASEVSIQSESQVEVTLRELVGQKSARLGLVECPIAKATELSQHSVGVLWAKSTVPLWLHPLLIYRKDTLNLEEDVLFLHRVRGQRYVEYLSYATGRTERDKSTVAKMTRLLNRSESDDASAREPPPDLKITIVEAGRPLLRGTFRGAIEFGRQLGPEEELFSAQELEPDVWRIAVTADRSVSRRQLLVVPIGPDRIEVRNVAQYTATLPAGERLEPGASCEHELPCELAFGEVGVRISTREEDTLSDDSAIERMADAPPSDVALPALPETTAELSAFLQRAVELVEQWFNCRTSRVLLLEGEIWHTAAVGGSSVRSNPSIAVLGRLRQHQQVVFTGGDDNGLDGDESLAEINIVLAIPILDSRTNILRGALYCDLASAPTNFMPPPAAAIDAAQALATHVADALARTDPVTRHDDETRPSNRPAPLTVRDPVYSSDTFVIHFPTPVAIPYRRFCQQTNPRAKLERLFLATEAALRYLVIVGVSDLFQCIALRDDEDESPLDHPAFEFLRRPIKMPMGRWLDALRTLAQRLKSLSDRFVTELPDVCAAGGELDEDLFGTLIAHRNNLAHASGSLPASDDECREHLRVCRPLLDEALRQLRFLRLYPLGFVAPFPHAPADNSQWFFVHSCMGSQVATAERAFVIETSTQLAQRIPFLAAPDGRQLLYLWPLLAQREAEATQQPSLYVFEEIGGKAGAHLTRVRRSAINVRDVWEDTLYAGPQTSFAWLFERLRSVPIVQDVSPDLGISGRLQPSRGGRLAGHHLGNNELLAAVASGGFGTIYEARAADGNRVAVKALESREVMHQYGRFRREIEKLAAAADNPGIIRCYESGNQIVDEQIVYWYSMEFADGGDLAEWIETHAEGQPQILLERQELREEVIARFRAIVSAVAHLHGLDIVHRDIKPSNVLIMHDGRLCLSDFGLAKGLNSSAASMVTSTAAAVGTPRYMAPEQKQGHEADKSADVYALGVLLAELATGSPPHPETNRNSGSALQQWPPLQSLPRSLAEFVRLCTDVDSARRPHDAASMSQRFDAVVEDL